MAKLIKAISLVSVVALCWGGALWLSLSVGKHSLDDMCFYLKNLKKMISCADVASGSQCFHRYKAGLSHEIKYLVNSTTYATLQNCFTGVYKEKRDIVIFFKLAQCLYRADLETVFSDKNSNVAQDGSNSAFSRAPRLGLGANDDTGWAVVSLASLIIMILPLVTAARDWMVGQSDVATVVSSLPNDRYPLALKSPKPVVIKIKSLDETYDLSDEGDLRKWREKFRIYRADEKRDILTSNKVELASGVHAFSGSADTDKDQGMTSVHGKRMDSKARTDINIHDPSKPVPSVLHFPKMDHRGKLHHRVFLPGRGWLSVKELERERRELLAQMLFTGSPGLEWQRAQYPKSPNMKGSARAKQRSHSAGVASKSVT